MNDKRESFVFYRSFYEVIKLLDDSKAKAMLSAIGNYALDGIEPAFEDNILKAIWLPIQPQLDANRRRYENGKRGGKPKANQGASGSDNDCDANTSEIKTACLTTEPKMDAIIKPQFTTTPIESTPAPQSIPSLMEVRLFAQNEGLNVDPERFYGYYQKHEWKAGPDPLYNWQAMMRKWHQNAEIKNREANSPLGVGERYDETGNRTYGESGIIVPPDAPRRPSEGHWWNTTTNMWEKCI